VVEGLVWADIESFLLRPEEILERLKEHLLLQDRERPLRKKELAKLTAQRQQKVAERDRVLALFRRGRIDEEVLDQQLDLIQNETATLQEQIDSAGRALSIPDRASQLEAASKLLHDLRLEFQEQSISPELQRRLVEILVESIEARTVERWGVPHSEIVIRYRFSQPHESSALLWSCAHRLDTSCVLAVSMMMGVRKPPRRSSRHTSKPSLLGSITSSRIRSNGSERARRTASTPSATTATS
jgi:hypothetical protein